MSLSGMDPTTCASSYFGASSSTLNLALILLVVFQSKPLRSVRMRTRTEVMEKWSLNFSF